MKTFALLGHPLTHSFSRGYFNEKFRREALDAQYINFDLPSLDLLRGELEAHPDLVGMNVTIPYKQQVIPLLDGLDPVAEAMGAVNVIRVEWHDGVRRLIGYNSDYKGFEDSIRPLIDAARADASGSVSGNASDEAEPLKALVLGTGGASKAVLYALRRLGVEPTYVSRRPVEGGFTYGDLTPELMADYRVVVNCTPVGMFPHVDERPDIPYEGLTSRHVCYDLIYNPAETAFLAEARRRGAVVCNGAAMLEGQAIEAWRIWNM
jgi:shikimate dehydrogenase